jgi:hypothetical protein
MKKQGKTVKLFNDFRGIVFEIPVDQLIAHFLFAPPLLIYST